MSNEKEYPIKVLYYTDEWVSGGITSFIMNIYRNIDTSKIKIDILVSQNDCDIYDNEIASYSGSKKSLLNIKYRSPIMRTLKSISAFKKEIKNNSYKIVHFHLCHAVSLIYVSIAKKAGVPVRIVHSHNTNISGGFTRLLKILAHNFCKTKFQNVATDYFACSELAAKWLYTNEIIKNKKVQLILNGINIDNFILNKIEREKVRNQLGIWGNFVICHVGRFIEQKNHNFLIDVFAEVYDRNRNAVLLLIGEGPLECNIESKVKRLGLKDNVIFAGVTQEVEKYFFASDVFVLPSLFEGLGIVNIEAQVSGLKCIVADTIPTAAKITDDLEYISLSKPTTEWADTILKYQNGYKRYDNSEMVRNAGYDITIVAKELENLYIKKFKN